MSTAYWMMLNDMVGKISLIFMANFQKDLGPYHNAEYMQERVEYCLTFELCWKQSHLDTA